MRTDMIQALEALGVEIVCARHVVIEYDDGTVAGLDDDGRPTMNRDKDGNVKDVFVVLPKNKKIKVYHGNSRAAVEAKRAAKTPDITKEKKHDEISDSRS